MAAKKPAANNSPYQNRIELLQGTLDLLILQVLRQGPRHGYAISQMIRDRSGDAFNVETGSLYPALHRLEKQGWLASEWKYTDANQRAKHYCLTNAGKKQLAVEHDRWQRLVSAMAGVLRPLGAEE